MDIRERINQIPNEKMVTLSTDNNKVEFSVPAKDLKAILAPVRLDSIAVRMKYLREVSYDPYETINS